MTHFVYCDRGAYTDEINLRLSALVSDLYSITGDIGAHGTPYKVEEHLQPSLDRLFYESEEIKALFGEYLKVQRGESPHEKITRD